MNNGSYLNRDQIAAANDLAAEDLAVPEWGGTIRIRGMTSGERDRYRQDYGDGIKASAKFLAATIIDGDGKAIFTEADVELLAGKSAMVIQRILEVALRLSGLQTGAAVIAEKNSEASPSASSPSN